MKGMDEFSDRVSLNKNDELLNQTGEHIHLPNPDAIAAKKIWWIWKEMYVFPRLQPITLADGSNAVLANVPKLDAARRRRQHSAALACSPISKTKLFQINTPFNNLSIRTPFIIYDNKRRHGSNICHQRHTRFLVRLWQLVNGWGILNCPTKIYSALYNS